MEHPLITNVRKALNDFPGSTATFNSQFNEVTERVVARMLTLYPGLFPDVECMMGGPVDVVKDSVVEAKTLALCTHYDMSVSDNVIATHGDFGGDASKLKTAIIDTLAVNIGDELTHIQANLRVKGFEMCPYIVALPMFTVDPGSFQPRVQFKTRYGVYNPNAKKIEETA